jgi:hypothetical protein
MNAAEIHAILSEQYTLASTLHAESMRIADVHGGSFTDDPHYLMVSSVQAGVHATITALNLLLVATPAEAAV